MGNPLAMFCFARPWGTKDFMISVFDGAWVSVSSYDSCAMALACYSFHLQDGSHTSIERKRKVMCMTRNTCPRAGASGEAGSGLGDTTWAAFSFFEGFEGPDNSCVLCLTFGFDELGKEDFPFPFKTNS